MKKTIEINHPHSLLEALKQRPEDVIEVKRGADRRDVDTPERKGVWQEVEDLCRRHNIRRTTDIKFLATLKAREATPLAELLSLAKNTEKSLILVLDCIQDPHNLGAIFRSAAVFGVSGIVMAEDRASPLSGIAYDVASGGVEHVPFSVVVNIKNAMEEIKEEQFWCLGTSEHADQEISTLSRDRNWAIILGSEEKGMRRLTEETCDLIVKIPQKGPLASLNVSVACGVLLSHFSLE